MDDLNAVLDLHAQAKAGSKRAKASLEVWALNNLPKLIKAYMQASRMTKMPGVIIEDPLPWDTRS